MHTRWRLLAPALLCCLVVAVPTARARRLPQPLAAHPGNIFLAGEAVSVAVPAEGNAWRLVDYEGKEIAFGTAPPLTVGLGRLPVGWYEVRWTPAAADTNAARLSLAVLAPLRAPTPATSPVAVDVAMAWFSPPATMPAVANLCTLAGVKWVRDRLSWPEMEPVRGQLAGPSRYDDSTRIQAAAGLRQLQVNHASPPWANTNHARFPTDLRAAYDFYRAMAERWRGTLGALEPWNEPDIPMFGGQIGSEIATLQKAAYLGLKAGNRRLIGCESVFALHQPAILEDFADNEAWPYFDTFNLHHYAPFKEYPRVYADFRAVSAGKPLWVTECSVPVPWSGDERLKEPSAADLRRQAERVVKLFATALQEGPSEVFYFLLPHYVEAHTQFGILRPDLTPRPAYAALAAVGRLLAGARPLGRLTAEGGVEGYFFRARPDGQAREVLVAWAADAVTPLALPRTPVGRFDLLGRPQPICGPGVALSSAPTFILLPVGTAARLALTPPPGPAPRREGAPSPIVLQARLAPERVILARSAYRIDPTRTQRIPLRIYNFGSRAVEGRLRVSVPPGWQCEAPGPIALAGGSDATLTLTLAAPGGDAPAAIARLRITGDFGRAGRPVLSLRLWPEPAR